MSMRRHKLIPPPGVDPVVAHVILPRHIVDEMVCRKEEERQRKLLENSNG